MTDADIQRVRSDIDRNEGLIQQYEGEISTLKSQLNDGTNTDDEKQRINTDIERLNGLVRDYQAGKRGAENELAELERQQREEANKEN